MNSLTRRIATAATGFGVAATIGLATVAAASGSTAAAAPAAPKSERVVSAAVAPAAQVQQFTAAASADTDRSAFVRSLPAVREGQRNEYVLALQVGLKLRGYGLDGTGYFGPATKAAVSDWQRKHGITASGLVGVQTWNSLVGSPVSAKPGNPQLSPGGTWTYASCDLRSGIAELGELFGTSAGLNVQSCLDEWSRAPYRGAEVTAVKAIQSRAGINPSGIVGERTTNAIHVASVLYSSNCRCG
ncbi:peptidoglycan-binding domain-containing protein [Nakamurella aerolata]|uniref:Peptidoglycan-binding protein n=1 Tax=Nakamurella aerolata TaxID=1656892 RepID=A0A849A9H0_9ACTN|nr:peptidoglycan-binding protein [Nakamurella aerolata]NNG35130.1 peptidoglycan-binding protein [Nakamurella aerolata]